MSAFNLQCQDTNQNKDKVESVPMKVNFEQEPITDQVSYVLD